MYQENVLERPRNILSLLLMLLYTNQGVISIYQ